MRKLFILVSILFFASNLYAEGFGSLFADRASKIKTETTTFDNILTSSNTTVQSALNSIDDYVASSVSVNSTYIRLDGTSITTASIPFAEGLSIATGKNFTFGTNQWNFGDLIDGTKVANADLGQISVSSGSWSIDTLTSAGLASKISDETGSGLAVFATSPTFTTSIQIPSASNPTVDAEGEFAWDNDDDNIRVYGCSGSNNCAVNGIYYFSTSIYNPDGIQSTEDAVPVFSTETDVAPFGITLISVGIKTDVSSSYTVNFEEWTSPTDGAPSTIESVATSSTTEAEDDGTLTDSSIAAGSIIYVDLPTTDIDMLVVWGTFYINSGD